MKSILVFLTSLFISGQAMALQCQVIVVTEEEHIEENFVAPATSQGHNVPEMTVTGQRHEVTAMADGKWLGLSWRKDGELLAESISLIRDVTSQPRVLLIYNPVNVDEQISLDCQD